MIFSATCYSELPIPISSTISVNFYQVKILCFIMIKQPVQPLLVKKRDVKKTVIALRNSKY